MCIACNITPEIYNVHCSTTQVFRLARNVASFSGSSLIARNAQQIHVHAGVYVHVYTYTHTYIHTA